MMIKRVRITTDIGDLKKGDVFDIDRYDGTACIIRKADGSRWRVQKGFYEMIEVGQVRDLNEDERAAIDASNESNDAVAYRSDERDSFDESGDVEE